MYYLRGIGYDLGKIVQTGANFGGNVKHESPYLSSIGSGTMVEQTLARVGDVELFLPPLIVGAAGQADEVARLAPGVDRNTAFVR